MRDKEFPQDDHSSAGELEFEPGENYHARSREDKAVKLEKLVHGEHSQHRIRGSPIIGCCVPKPRAPPSWAPPVRAGGPRVSPRTVAVPVSVCDP